MFRYNQEDNAPFNMVILRSSSWNGSIDLAAFFKSQFYLSQLERLRPIHMNTMEFHSVVAKSIFGAKLSNVNNPISRNGEVIYLAETYQQSWNLLWNVSLFGTICCQSFVQNFKSGKFRCLIQFFEIASATWNSFVILLRAKNRCQWLQSDSCWGWHQWHEKLKRGVVVWQ